MLPLKEYIVYGPVRSRRLGQSLGINLLPAGRKRCTFNCLYCHYGWTPPGSCAPEENRHFCSVESVVQAVEQPLKEISESLNFLTFSGNGEPTLHPDFPQIVEAIVILRNRIAPRVKIALLSNASRLDDVGIRLALHRLDLPIMKLDAGNDSIFRAFNRPVQGIDHLLIVAGIRKLKCITIQSLFSSGPLGNTEQDHLLDWVEKVTWIKPSLVQLYTLSRPSPCTTIYPASSAALLDIRNRLNRAGIQAEVF